MRKALPALAMCATLLLVPSQAFAWGFAAHQLIMQKAIDLLLPELKPFYEHFRSEVEMRVVDPDLWRNAGWPEEPNHFLNLGVPEYGKAPFVELPREYGAALQKFGAATLDKYGRLPWREAEMFGNLRRGFEGIGRNGPYAISNVTFFSAVTAHYLQDSYQPFHATDNFDGQKTGNSGIHSRFETELILRFAPRLRLSPSAPLVITNPRDAAFEALVVSNSRCDQILAADKAAIGSKATYDDYYFETFFLRVQPILEEQLSRAISATAGMIIGAWEQAGRPVLYTELPRVPQRVRQ